MRSRSSSASASTSMLRNVTDERSAPSRRASARSAPMASSTPGYWTFTATARPVGQRGPVHLADRGGGHGHRVPAREQLRDVRPELVAHDAFGQRRGHRRGVRLQLGQRIPSLVGETVDHEGQHLPELHHRALHVAELAGHVLGRAHGEAVVELGPPVASGHDAPHASDGQVDAATHGQSDQPQPAGAVPTMGVGSLRSRFPPGEHDDVDHEIMRSARGLGRWLAGTRAGETTRSRNVPSTNPYSLTAWPTVPEVSAASSSSQR